MKMKTLARIGAGLSFSAFVLGGVCRLAMSGFRFSGEYILLTALGLFFVGTAFFAGLILWLSAEKWAMKNPADPLDQPDPPFPWKIIRTVIGFLVGVMVGLPLLRMLASVLLR